MARFEPVSSYERLGAYVFPIERAEFLWFESLADDCNKIQFIMGHYTVTQSEKYFQINIVQFAFKCIGS